MKPSPLKVAIAGIAVVVVRILLVLLYDLPRPMLDFLTVGGFGLIFISVWWAAERRFSK